MTLSFYTMGAEIDKMKNHVDVEEMIYIQELHAALDDAMTILTDREFEVLTLKYYFDISYHEQARNEGVSVSAIMALANNAIERIRASEHINFLAEFLPSLDHDPNKYTPHSAWEQDESVQDKYLSRTENVRQLLI